MEEVEEYSGFTLINNCFIQNYFHDLCSFLKEHKSSLVYIIYESILKKFVKFYDHDNIEAFIYKKVFLPYIVKADYAVESYFLKNCIQFFHMRNYAISYFIKKIKRKEYLIKILKIFIGFGYDLNSFYKGELALDIAYTKGYTNVVIFLLKNGANFNLSKKDVYYVRLMDRVKLTSDMFNITDVSEVFTKNMKVIDIELFKYLLLKVNVYEREWYESLDSSFEILSSCIVDNREDIFLFLLDNVYKKSYHSHLISLSLIYSCRFGNERINFVKILIEYGADVNMKYKGELRVRNALKKGYNAVMEAIYDHHYDIFLHLYNNGAIYNNEDCFEVLLNSIERGLCLRNNRITFENFKKFLSMGFNINFNNSIILRNYIKRFSRKRLFSLAYYIKEIFDRGMSIYFPEFEKYDIDSIRKWKL